MNPNPFTDYDAIIAELRQFHHYEAAKIILLTIYRNDCRLTIGPEIWQPITHHEYVIFKVMGS